MKPDTKHKARLEILHYVLSFCTSRQYGPDKKDLYPGGRGFRSAGKAIPAEVGDLILLSSAPATKWTIGWLVEIDASDAGWDRYLIESLEDGALCWWGNVGIAFLDREILNGNQDWRWTDRQWAFKDRWWKVCYNEKDAYIVRPMFPVFGYGFEVTLGTRTSHGFDDITPKRSFPDWRKVTKAMMAQCYDDCVAERDRIAAERKAVAA